jgi:hypothetical protein
MIDILVPLKRLFTNRDCIGNVQISKLSPSFPVSKIPNDIITLFSGTSITIEYFNHFYQV